MQRSVFFGLLLIAALLVSEAAAIKTSKQSKPSPKKTLSERIKHVVVLMEENRSFDHMLGHYRNKNSPKGPQGPVNGLRGTEWNPINESDPSKGRVKVSPTARYINECDPNHSTPPTTYKIFGQEAFAAKNYTNPTMNGFVEFENSVRKNGAEEHYCGVMESFTSDRLPVMSGLADEFLLFDNFFASHPGPTWPNRLFFLSATSAGLTETGPWYQDAIGRLYPQKTIYDQVAEAGGTWKNYFNDTPWEMMMATVANNPEHVVPMDQFFEDAKTGNLPDFSFINPRVGINFTAGLGSNDQHPDHDVALGERYYKDIYEALRAGPAWNETLFIITYDEHGGFYDHVPTPLNVPPPADGRPSFPDQDYKFDRLGIRIPTLLISPWIQKGKVKSSPSKAQKPFPNSEFELTSIMASTRKILAKLNGTGPLTKRDAWAATFEDELMLLDEPRTDCPMHLPDAPPPSPGYLEKEAALPINSLQEHVLTFASHFGKMPHRRDAGIHRQEQAGDFLAEGMRRHRERTAAWKAAKPEADATAADGQPKYKVQMMPWGTGSGTEWIIRKDPKVNFVTIETITGGYCLDSGAPQGKKPEVGMPLRVSPCFPSAHPTNNTDTAQQWIYRGEQMLRPIDAQELCAESFYTRKGVSPVLLQDCVMDSVNQHFAYMGQAPGYTASNVIGVGASIINVVFANNTDKLGL